MENKETFNYTYSAKEQDEIKAIRKKYTTPEKTEDKMALLRRLDAGVTGKAQAVSLVLGVIGALLLGVGMSLSMSDFSKILGAHEGMAMLIGITIGIVGIVLVSLAYPLYNRIVKKERARIAPEIIRLTDELMKLVCLVKQRKHPVWGCFLVYQSSIAAFAERIFAISSGGNFGFLS